MTELIFPVCLSMISNQSQGAPGLVSFCFLTTSKSETIFLGDNLLDCDYCARVSVRCPHSGAGAGCQAEVWPVWPRVCHPPTGARARGKDDASVGLSEARMEPRQKQGGWALARRPGLVHQGGGGGGPWVGAGAERERGDHRVTGATEPLSVWGGTRDRMVLTRGHEAAEMALWWLLGQCWQVQKRLL